MSEETAVRIAIALERLTLTIATLLPGDEKPPESTPAFFMTQDGPIFMTKDHVDDTDITDLRS